MSADVQTKCVGCGRFISYREMEERTARFHFEPDSHRGPEISEWTCAACVSPESASPNETDHANR